MKPTHKQHRCLIPQLSNDARLNMPWTQRVRNLSVGFLPCFAGIWVCVCAVNFLAVYVDNKPAAETKANFMLMLQEHNLVSDYMLD